MQALFQLSINNSGNIWKALRSRFKDLGWWEGISTILYASKKKGGVNSTNGVCPLLRNWFRSNNLCDLDFQGPRFTWSHGSLYKGWTELFAMVNG